MSVPYIYTTDLLAANGVYTGAWVRVYGPDSGDVAATRAIIPHDKVWMRGAALADQNSAAGGLVIQQSNDGATAQYTSPVAVVANVQMSFDVQLFMRYARIVYTNGAVAQTSFTLNARLAEEA